MPLINKPPVPEKLKPYDALKVLFNIPRDTIGVGAISGVCPWCKADGKFNVTVAEGLWRCVVCNIGSEKTATSKGGGGNVFTFLRVLHDLSMKATVEDEYKQLAQEFNLLYTDTLKAWGVCRSVIDNVWVAPGYSVQNGTKEGGKLVTLYRYVFDPKQNKKRWFVTTGLSHGIMGPDIPTPKGGFQVAARERVGPVYRLEGLKDAMAFYEIALRAKVGDEGLSPTSNPEASLLWTGSVVAIPGAGIFNPSWATISANRPDYSFYHNDHPKEVVGGKIIQPALDGTKKVVGIMAQAAPPPKELRYLRWGHDTFHDANLKSGYDVRDHLAGPSSKNNQAQRIRQLDDILTRLQPIPQEWVTGSSEGGTNGSVLVAEEECKDWKTLLNALRDVLKVTPAIERTFAAMIASILSVPSAGDQLWLMVIGPPSSAKSTLCEAISSNRQYVLPKDTMTGLFSGWQQGLEKDQNLSLAGEMMNKTLVIKDGDTILQSPNLSQILSQLRALYDRCVRTSFKNKMSKDWEGLNATVILCGTATLLQMDAAERGARYLTVDIQPDNDYEREDEIVLRVANKAFGDFATHADATGSTAEMTKLKRLTAGYISHLRSNAISLIEGVADPSGESLRLCGSMATFASYMRCRPPKKQNEKVEREMPYRLTSQLVRLARGLAVVYNRKTLDEKVLHDVRQIAINTAQGRIMDLCDELRSYGKTGRHDTLLGQGIGMKPEEALDTLRFLRKIQAVEIVPRVSTAVRTGRPRWRLSGRVAGLYDKIFGPGATTRGQVDTGDDD